MPRAYRTVLIAALLTFPITIPASPYEPFAANEGGGLVEKERTRLERELKALLIGAGREKQAGMFEEIPKTDKKRIVECFAIFKKNGLDEKRTIAGASMIIESAFGVRNAKIFIEEWTKNGKRASVETYMVAPKIKSAGKFAPEILLFFNVPELEEIDRLQKEVFGDIIAQSEQRTAQSEQRTAQSEQRTARYKKAADELEKLLGKY